MYKVSWWVDFFKKNRFFRGPVNAVKGLEGKKKEKGSGKKLKGGGGPGQENRYGPKEKKRKRKDRKT